MDEEYPYAEKFMSISSSSTVGILLPSSEQRDPPLNKGIMESQVATLKVLFCRK